MICPNCGNEMIEATCQTGNGAVEKFWLCELTATYHCTIGDYTGGIQIERGVVVEAPPCFKKWKGQNWQNVRNYYGERLEAVRIKGGCGRIA